jgi:hypothetical protein
MSTQISTPPPKPKGRHNHSKSATPTAPHHTYDGSQPKSNKRRTKKAQSSDPENGFYDSFGAQDDLPASYLIQNGVVIAGHSDGGMPPSTSKKNRRKPRRHEGEGYQKTDSPPQQVENTQSEQDLPTATPAKKAMAYAGPTFHASPAASALPVPRFFSKSVPADTKSSSLQTRLEEDEDGAGQSPTEDNAALAPEVREESPLDVFFKADREERAKRKSGLLTPTSKLERLDSYDSASSVPSRHHSRQPSNGSGRGMFAMELDGTGIQSSSHTNVLKPRSVEHQPSQRSVTAPSGGYGSKANSMADDEKTASLRNMLNSISSPQQPLPTPPADTGPTPSEPASRFHTPSPFYNRPSSVPGKDVGLSTPPSLPNGRTDTELHYGNRNLSPFFKAVQGDSVKRSSSLRHEVSDPAAGNTFDTQRQMGPEMGTPTRSAPQKMDASAISRNYLNFHIHSAPSMPELPLQRRQSLVNSQAYRGPVTELPANAPKQFPTHRSAVQSTPNISQGVSSNPIPSQFSSSAVPRTSSASPDIRSMENDLRRLLNLNGAGAAPGGV